MSALHGGLITRSVAASLHTAPPGGDAAPAGFYQLLARWSARREATLGPASSARAIGEVAVVPLFVLLGYDVRLRPACVDAAAGPATISIQLASWGDELGSLWRGMVLSSVAADRRWAAACNGRCLRIVDAHRTWSRQYLEFDLEALSEDAVAQAALWHLLHAAALARTPSRLDAAVDLSARQGANVCRALGSGVLAALERLLEAVTRRAERSSRQALEQSLTVVYRLLFLLFAEARGLVPIWHPVYRDRYTIASIVDALLAGRECRGIWPAVLAISRLAHSGCAAGTLTVTAFNGRLFAPAQAALLERALPDDRVMSAVVLAVSTVASPQGRTRIAYDDLDVEQLGAVYERVLDIDRDARKSTGTFYTPRPMADALVRQTLDPLTRGHSSTRILALRVLDPAMGSGAFLVAACRYLADAVETARVAEGVWHPADVTAADRVALRREIASRCLFGVDLNPMAVQLARLSLWLASLAADRPLTFLDHHLAVGNSLVGAAPDDVRRQPGGSRGRRRPGPLPLFDTATLAPVLEHVVTVRRGIINEPDDSAAIVRRKERALSTLHADVSALSRWRRVLDLWCGGWFSDDGPLPASAFPSACDFLLGRPTALPERTASRIAARSADVAAAHSFFHWPLMFPEVFVDDRGEPLPAPGFDAVIGNPPWDMVRGDSGGPGARSSRRDDARRLGGFVRDAGIYAVDPGAHINRYQVFVERALQLTRRGGRIGLVLPAGVIGDAGAAGLRRHLFDRASVESIVGLDNRRGIFAIHRSVRFVLLAGTRGGATSEIACRFGVSRLEQLERPHGAPMLLTRRLLARVSGEEDLGIPEMPAVEDLAIVEKIASTTPWLGSMAGWNVRFGRELNATDDHDAFRAPGNADGRPVLEGKQIEPFRASVETSTLILPDTAPLSARVPRRSRLAYREVASATNRLTLIAAMIPARCVTTHTLFCLKGALPLDAQHVLCALLNSFVANYLVRMRVNTHVTASVMSRLPVPLLEAGSPHFERLAALSRTLSASPTPIERQPEYAELQALAARLYALDGAEFEHVLSTFPLVAAKVRDEAAQRFQRKEREERRVR